MDLLGCPFCGETTKLHAAHAEDDEPGRVVYVVCGICGSNGPWADSRTQAIANWNRRPASTLAAGAQLIPGHTGEIHFTDGSPPLTGAIAAHWAIPVRMTGEDDLSKARDKRDAAGLPSVDTHIEIDGLAMDFDLGGPPKGKR